MTTAKSDAKPYHHGDLRRGLVEAAREILEAEGPGALSLRAVARQAGVSPAAPYHHFKDKSELLDAVAHEGWIMLDRAMSKARDEAQGRQKLSALGIAYVCFARQHPALYRVMYDAARDKEALPRVTEEGEDSAYCKVRQTLIDLGADAKANVDLELATVAAWCAAHGLAEMAGFKQFEHLVEAMGGETAFFRGVFAHMALFPRPRHES